MSIKLKGSTDGSVTLQAPADTSPTGTDKTLILPTGVGSANQFLQNGSTAGTLEFGSLVSSDMPTGSVLQVVHGSTSTEVNVDVATYTDTGLSASITPNSTSSKILIFVNQHVLFYRGANGMGLGVNILRDSTTIHETAQDSTGPFDFYNNNSTSQYTRFSLMKLDSPSTTSSITYKTQGRPYTAANSGGAQFQTDSVIDGTSYITLIEVAG